jgi:DNA-binding transcriptional ArsR family regulator
VSRYRLACRSNEAVEGYLRKAYILAFSSVQALKRAETDQNEVPAKSAARRDRPEVKGNTLRVYLFLLRSGTSELREVQRSLGFSTPSLASYHLGKLVEAGYVTQDEHGRYMVIWDATKDLLEGYIRIGTVVFPRLFFFSVLFTPVIAFMTVMTYLDTAYFPFLATSSIALVGAFWYETVKVWKKMTSWK